MANHKDLTGNEIHETKTSIVAGSPLGPLGPGHLNLTASAAGIVVVDSSTLPNRVWRAKSTTAGDWELCSPSSVSELSDGPALLLVINNLISRVAALEALT